MIVNLSNVLSMVEVDCWTENMETKSSKTNVVTIFKEKN